MKPKKCICGKLFTPKYLTTEKFCSFECAKNGQKPKANKKQPPIKRRATKRQVQELQYNVLRIEFLGKKENQICPVTGQKTNEVHHKKGRIGALLTDVRYFLAVSHDGHKKIENNPKWAKEMGYSLSRLAKD